MTSLSTRVSPDLLIGDDLTAAGYSDKELSLIAYCWQDSQEINRSKVSLAQHLWQLKQEMDANDPHVGNSPTKSRFWTAFEAGHLPLQGDKGRQSVHTCIKAAQWLASRDLSNPSDNSFSNLAPATICEISTLDEPAQKVVLQSVESCEFIGVAAVRLLSSEKEPEVFDRLAAWVSEHPKQPVTPKTIRLLKAEVEQENRPAHSQTVDVNAAAFQDILGSIRDNRTVLRQKAEVEEVKHELGKADREHRELLNAEIQAYNKNLNAASGASHDLLAYLRTLSNLHGTQLLAEMRATDYRGFITVADDMDRLKAIGAELMEAVKLAQSSEPPTGIDMTTVSI